MRKPSPESGTDTLIVKFSVVSTQRSGKRLERSAANFSPVPAGGSPTPSLARYTSRTSRAQTVHSSMESGSARRAWNLSPLSSRRTTLWSVVILPRSCPTRKNSRNLTISQEFGIDIVGEDNKTIIHHKVAARVTCILTPEDATNASREHFAFSQHQAQQQQQQAQQHPGQAQLGQMQQGQQRRPSVHAPPHSHLGAMAPTRVPGKSGLTFDHILSRLQAELHKSRETGAELHQLTGAMTDIHDTLGGAMVSVATRD